MHKSAVSLTVTMDFETYYLPTAQVHCGYEFLLKLERSNLTSHQKEEVKLRCLKFLKEAAKAVLKRLPPAPDFLLKLKVLFPIICLLQLCLRFSDLPLYVIPVLNISELYSQWRRLLVVDWASACGGEIPSDSCEFWVKVLHHLDPVGFPPFCDLTRLALSLLSLPISNAAVERSFSMMDVVKKRLRNQMLLPMLNSMVVFRLWLSVCGICCSEFEPTKEMLQL